MGILYTFETYIWKQYKYPYVNRIYFHMKTRIKELISYEKSTAAQFANEIGIAPSSLHHIVSGRNNPSLEVIQKILNRFPHLNAEWLINGKGNRFKELVQGELFSMPKEDSRATDGFQTKLIEQEDTRTLNTPIQQNMDAIPPLVNADSSKTVDKIMILYKDKSFDIYNS